MKLIVAGCREVLGKGKSVPYYDDFHNQQVADGLVLDAFAKYIDVLINVTEIVSGGAKGIDKAGERFASKYELPLKRISANWEKLGKKAGFIRNVEMANYADSLLAIWDGKSKGTEHMINTMNKLKKQVYLFEFKPIIVET